jgi:hypothetical protein
MRSRSNTAAGAKRPVVRWWAVARRRAEAEAVAPQVLPPLVPPGPRSAAYFPVAVLVAVLPGLFGLRQWDLTPPGPWWGLRGLAVLEGHGLDQTGLAGLGPASEAQAYRVVALQPPLYAWLEAAALMISGDRAPLATVVPSTLAGVAVVLLVYGHGRLWGGPALGLLAAVLTGFNRDLLAQMQLATPATLGLAAALAALLAYGHALRAGDVAGRRRLAWSLLGGVALGLSLLAVGLFGLVLAGVLLMHRGLLGAEPRRPRRRRAADAWWPLPLTTLGLGLLIALPWHVGMFRRHGVALLGALVAPPMAAPPVAAGLLGRVVMLAPASVATALLAAVCAVRRVRDAEPGTQDRRTVSEALWLAWLGVAALVPAALPAGPRPVMQLFLLVPLNLLAARAMIDLAERRLSARALILLAPATALAMAWWASAPLRAAVGELARGRVPQGARAAGAVLGLSLLLMLPILVGLLDRWAGRHDARRRRMLGLFLGGVLSLTIGIGLREIRFRHRETADLLALRDAILRRQALKPFTLLAVVGPESDPATGAPTGRPGGRLRFLLRSALPELAQIDLASPDDLLALPGGQRLVVLAGADSRLSYAMQARLRLEAIHPGRSGILDAYATPHEPEKPARRR